MQKHPNETTVEIDINNLKEKYIFNKVAKQASGAVMYAEKQAVLIAAVAIDEEAVDEDFLPLTVQYIEKAYAAAKIPGGFIKRETKPGDFETLTSRIIDRALRPLFPKGFHYPVTVTVMVVSSDEDVDMQIAALHAANAALFISDIPVTRAIAAVRIGTENDNLTINPRLSRQKESTLDLLVVGSGKDVVMIEMCAMASEDEKSQNTNALSEDALIEAISMASDAIEKVSAIFTTSFTPMVREPLALEMTKEKTDEALYTFIKTNYTDEIEEAITQMAKSERSNALKRVTRAIVQRLENEGKKVDKAMVAKVLQRYKKTVVRTMILEKNIRADGRALDEVRAISIETNLLPSVHGSCLFTRGETQALVTVTLGEKKDAQTYEMITSKKSHSENFMLHYNFPGYSVGEASFVGAPGRRELGHGNLAKRALEPTVALSYEGTIRVVSEILESNGSSSMATVCGGSLALRAAEVETTSLVAGIAMGLVAEGSRYAVLTDIMGLEDYDGDMDFKIAGTREGVTAMQMDIKLSGIETGVLKEALIQARKAKEQILSQMEDAVRQIRTSQALPSTENFFIHPSKVVDIIGRAGATIREIIGKFEVSIDLDRNTGGVKVTGRDKQKVAAAKEHIENLASVPAKKQTEYTVGEPYEGKVKRIVDFGLFVEMPDGFDALLHVSKVAKERVENLHERYKEGDIITVIVMEQKGNKVELATPEFLA